MIHVPTLRVFFLRGAWEREESPMARHNIVVMRASGGGVEGLARMVRAPPPGLPASLFVVCHFPRGRRRVVADILSRFGPLMAKHPGDGEPFYPGHVYLAPPDYHLLLA